MREYTDLMAAVYNALGTGHRNARTRAELCAALGCNDRELREAIEALRWDYPIITRDDGTGYYKPLPNHRGRYDGLALQAGKAQGIHTAGHQGRTALHGAEAGGMRHWKKA